jgi:hypothetical protein
MRPRTRVALFLLAFVVALSAAHVSAQTVTGTLSGHVVDSSGAVMPNVRVTAKNEQSGGVREATSNNEGYYLISFLPLGSYELTVVVPGFKTVEKKGLIIELNKNTVSDFTMQPSAVAATVEVTGEVPLIEATTGELKYSFDAKTVEDRPLPTRNFLHLAEIVPGFQTNAVSGQNNPTLSSGSSVNFNGTGTRGATFQVNGVNNDDSSENQNRQGVNVSTIAQVQILTNSFSAEFGRGYGAVVLVQTKSGTNAYHGDAYWFHVNSATTANELFRNAAGRNAQGRPIAPVPVQRRHQYGFTGGGPIKHDALFFYGSFDQVRNGGFLGFTRDILLPTERTPDPSVTNPADRAWIQGIIDRFPNVLPNNLASSPRAFSTTAHFSFPDEDYTGRVDWKARSNDTFAFRYQYSHQLRTADDVIRGERADQNNGQQNFGTTLTHVYSPRQVGELRFAVGRRRTRVDIAAGNDTPVVRFSGTPGSGSLIGNAGAFPIHRFQTDYQYVYNHSLQSAGRMTIRAGTDIRLQQLNDLADNSTRGFYTFGVTPGQNAYDNFRRGFVTTFQKGYGPTNLGNRIKEFNYYVQDDIRLRRNLILNVGVRYEYIRPPKEVHRLVDYGFGDSHDFEPRIGFAYSPAWSGNWIARITGGPGRFVIRGGYGIFHGRLFQSYFSQGGASIRFNPPNAAFKSFSNSSSVSDPTGGFVFVPGPPTTRVSITRVDPRLRMPYTQQWNLTVQREFPAQLALTVSYSGNRGIGLPLYDLLNRAEFPIVAPNHPFVSAANRGRLMSCIDPNLSNLNPAPGCISIAQARTDDRRPDPSFSGVFLIRNGSWSYYHGLQVKMDKRWSGGFALQTAWTWGKAIDTGSETTFTGIDTNVPISGPLGAKSMKGPSLFDIPHRLTINYSYEFPFFRKREGWLRQVLGGWQVSGTTFFSSGNPFTVFAGYDVNADGVGGDRPDILDPSILGRSIDNPRVDPATVLQVAQSQLPGAAFSPNATIAQANRIFRPGAENLGTLGRNTFRSHGQNNWDVALAKSFVFAESYKLLFRWEMYNAMNHPQFGVPNQTVISSGFGRISDQRNNRVDTQTGARYMQFALRFVF